MRQAAALTGLTQGDIIDRTFAPMEAGLHEVLALVSAYPELREQAANIIVSFGPESIDKGIKRIAPPGYETLAARFEREMATAMDTSRAPH
ncbi:MAG: hypothetical protein ABIQ08_06655 [Duganella sp.]